MNASSTQISALVWGGLLVLTAHAQPQPARAGTDTKPTLATKVDAYLRPFVEIHGFSGAVLVAQRGKILVNRGYGMANYELSVPNTARTKFHLGSVSKTFTAAAIMMLQQEGKLSVRDPVSRFVPGFRNGDRITIHHLLTNTSGIPNINNFAEYPSLSRFHHDPGDLIGIFKDKTLDFEPGTRGYTESNSNYNLLAYIIETLSGKSYGKFLQERILEPLGMNETGHDGDAGALVVNRASGYSPNGATGIQNSPYLDWSTKTGNGSIYSTVHDLYLWDRALYSNPILSDSSRGALFTQQYGWFSGTRLGRRVARMNGLSPGFSAEMERFVDDDVCIIVLSNLYISNTTIVADDIARTLFSGETVSSPLGPPVHLSARTLEQYTGSYKFGEDFFTPGALYTVRRSGDELLVGRDGTETSVIPLSETRFFHRPFWSEIEFTKRPDGAFDLHWRYGTSLFTGRKLDPHDPVKH